MQINQEELKNFIQSKSPYTHSSTVESDAVVIEDLLKKHSQLVAALRFSNWAIGVGIVEENPEALAAAVKLNTSANAQLEEIIGTGLSHIPPLAGEFLYITLSNELDNAT